MSYSNTDMESAPASAHYTSQSKTLVRINGVLPDVSTLGNSRSERVAEIKKSGATTNTSCSIFVKDTTSSSPISANRSKVFHVLVDIGEGVVESLEKIDLSSYSDFGLTAKSGSGANLFPDAVFITHSHDDHIKELPLLINKSGQKSKALEIFCTNDCRNQIISKYPEVSKPTNNKVSFHVILPNNQFQIGALSAIPIPVYHGDNSPPGSVIYVIKAPGNIGRVSKIIIGWDYLSLADGVDENLFWNPDLIILGTQSYNPHPQTGLISVSDAFGIIRRWNAKECYIVHYSGLIDTEEANNQWFRGPTKAMNSEELQKTIDENLRVTGKEGKFKITVAKEGMVWTARETEDRHEVKGEAQSSQLLPSIGKVLEIESLQNYILRFEKDDTNHMKLMIEDRINRFDLKFMSPHMDRTNNDVVYARGEKGTFASGPELKMEMLELEPPIVRINVFRGKKTLLKEDILVSREVMGELKRYIRENFVYVPS